MRHLLAFSGSVLFHAVLFTGMFWLANGKIPASANAPMLTAVSFDFATLIAEQRLISEPQSAIEPAIEPESIIEPEPVTEPEPASEPEQVIEPEPVIKPVVPSKAKLPKKVVKKKKPKKKVVKKKTPKKKVVKKKTAKKKTPKRKPVVKKTTRKPAESTALSAAQGNKTDNQPTGQNTTGKNTASQATGSLSTGKPKASQKASPVGHGKAYRSGLERAIGRVAQRNYPKKARRMRKQGIVRVRFHLAANGRISQISVVGSSGHASLDKAAVKALKRLGKYKKPPAGFPRTLTVPIRFRLR